MKKAVVAIGNFDGVHLGHRDLLTHARLLADRHGCDFVVLTFSPHPRSVFQADDVPFRITPDDVKNDLFTHNISPDLYEVLPFDKELQTKTADQFIDDILIGRLNAAIVMIGRNFHFGYQRSGNLETLENRAEFRTAAADIIQIGGERVSSSRIRNHLRAGEIAQANALLGWEWFIRGEVIHGDKRGREIGYPTANMCFGETIVPSYGVYAVRVQIEGEEAWREGAANIGIRPMFETLQPMAETYLFDFYGDLYGKTIKVKPVQKIRDEMSFDSLDKLIAQIDKDCDVVRNILGS